MITYTFDNSLSPRLVLCLSTLLPEHDEEWDDSQLGPRHNLRHLRDLDAGDSDPEVWVPRLASDEDVLVTCTASSRRKPFIALVRGSGLRTVHLADGFTHLAAFAQAAFLITHWVQLVTKSYRLKRGEAVVISMQGRIKDVE